MSTVKKPVKVKSQLRRDPTSGKWSIVQLEGDRHKECSDYLWRKRMEFAHRYCVFSRQFGGGRRQEKEPLFGLRWDNGEVVVTYDNWHSDDWEVMVVWADFAQVARDRSSILLGQDPFVAEAGFGIHQLIIEDPTEDHLPLGLMPGRTQLVLLAMLYRLVGRVEGFPPLDEGRAGKPLSEIEHVRHVSFFHNHRPEAGGSQEHPHAQLIASPIIPTDVAMDLDYVLARHQKPPRRCVYCEILEAELAIEESTPYKSRVLFKTEHFVALHPHCSIYPFETWILPRRHCSSFGEIRTLHDKSGSEPGMPSELEDFASVIDMVVGRLYVCLDDPAYNLLIKTQPLARPDDLDRYPYYHWHVRIEPRGLTTPGGYELATGIFSSPTKAEETAAFLRGWGQLSKADERKPGTIAWYLRLLRLTSDRRWMDALDAWVHIYQEWESTEEKKKAIQKTVESLEKELAYKRKLVHKRKLDGGGAARKEDRIDDLDGEIKEKKEEVAHRGAKSKKLRDSLEEQKVLLSRASGRHASLVADLFAFLEGTDQAAESATRTDQPEESSGDRASDKSWAALQEYLHRTPRRLRSILNFLGPDGTTLRDFARAQAAVAALEESRPDLFLSQYELPPEHKRGLQQMPEAGSNEGPHYRRCPATGRWVLIPSTSRRTSLAKIQEKQAAKTGSRWLPKDSALECGLCKPLEHGNEIVARVGKKSGGRKENRWVVGEVEKGLKVDKWTALVRSKKVKAFVIKNRDPLLPEAEDRTAPNPGIGGVGPFEETEGVGICEVLVIGGPLEEAGGKRHDYETCIGTGHLEGALAGVALRSRVLGEEFLSKSGPISRHITIFGNHRVEAGARVSHLNWQIMVAPIVSSGIAQELSHCRGYSEEYSGRCCFCDMIAAEEVDRSRLVFSGPKEPFVALVPYASRVPFEVWILPREHRCRIEESLPEVNGSVSSNVVSPLARTLSLTLRALYNVLADPGYSLIIKNAPISSGRHAVEYDHYHWRIIIETQGLSLAAGYEHLTGIWSNPFEPEEAARILREEAEKIAREERNGEAST